MTNTRFTTDPATLKAIARKQAAAKKAIQAKRRRDAITNANFKGIAHKGNFPTNYKYG